MPKTLQRKSSLTKKRKNLLVDKLMRTIFPSVIATKSGWHKRQKFANLRGGR